MMPRRAAIISPMILPFAFPLLLMLFVLLLSVLVLVAELRLLRYAQRKIGGPTRSLFVVVLVTLVGSLTTMPRLQMGGGPIVAVNTGGALVHPLLSLYLFKRLRLRGRLVVGTAIVAV